MLLDIVISHCSFLSLLIPYHAPVAGFKTVSNSYSARLLPAPKKDVVFTSFCLYVRRVSEQESCAIAKMTAQCRAPSRSRKPLRLAYDSLRLASRLKPASRSFYGGGVSYGGLRRIGE